MIGGTKSSSDTLLFTSAKSVELGVILKELYGEIPGRFYVHANPGLYSCTLTGNDPAKGCMTPKTVADGYDTEVFYTEYLDLTNLQFYVSPKNKDSHRSTSKDSNDDGNNYLYANIKYEHKEYGKRFSWEIIRADPMVPTDSNPRSNATAENHDDGHLLFRTYFRTLGETDWNNCNFDCCPFNDDVDSNGRQDHRDWHDWAYLHSYVRVRPSAYAIDHRTGDVFIAWQGFYKDCNPAIRFETTGMLKWSIGISRLMTHAEDPTCVSVRKENDEPLAFSDLEQNFARCTVPVSIIYQSSEGRNSALSFGGFVVNPAATEPPSSDVKPRRSFFLSAHVKDKEGQRNHLWAIPEGGDVTKYQFQRQELTTASLGYDYMDGYTDNGGNMKVHYNQQTGRPDHLCRTVFDQGIECMSIDMTEDNDSTYFTVTGDSQYLLNNTQVTTFCAPTREVTQKDLETIHFIQKTSIVTGLDVVWNEKDGTPDRIFFGCFGWHSDGRLGSVDGNGENLIEVFPGAYSGDVMLLPAELDSADVRESLRPDISKSSDQLRTISILKPNGAPIIAIVLVSCLALYVFYKKRYSSLASSSSLFTATFKGKENEGRRKGSLQKYMELPVINSTELTESSSSLSSGEFS